MPVAPLNSKPTDILCEKRLFLTRDRSRIVEDGDPDASILFANPGTLIPRNDAIRYGLISWPEPEPEPAPKRRGRGRPRKTEKTTH